MQSLSFVAAVLLGFACHQEDCLSLAQAYADEVHGYSLWCDPASPNPCGAQLPTIIYEQSIDGGLTLEALSSNCTHAVNPERVARAQRILNDYLARKCRYVPTPLCRPTTNRCSVEHLDAGWTCWD